MVRDGLSQLNIIGSEMIAVHSLALLIPFVYIDTTNNPASSCNQDDGPTLIEQD
jgi:hypothetical protein